VNIGYVYLKRTQTAMIYDKNKTFLNSDLCRCFAKLAYSSMYEGFAADTRHTILRIFNYLCHSVAVAMIVSLKY
jgi:hypothetical protein